MFSFNNHSAKKTAVVRSDTSPKENGLFETHKEK
jgi:hypothetical protein